MKIEIINPIKLFQKGFYWRKDMNDMGIWYLGGYIYQDKQGKWWSHNRLRKIIISALLLALLGTLLLFSAVQAKPCPWRNKHCRPVTPTVTVTATVISSPRRMPPPAGTPVYVCMALICATPATPGK